MPPLPAFSINNVQGNQSWHCRLTFDGLGQLIGGDEDVALHQLQRSWPVCYLVVQPIHQPCSLQCQLTLHQGGIECVCVSFGKRKKNKGPVNITDSEN